MLLTEPTSQTNEVTAPPTGHPEARARRPRRPKDIGTWTETQAVRFLRGNGFDGAERRALAGVHDLGDIVGTPRICWEVKGGKAAENASDAQVLAWLEETETERVNSGADVGVLVLKRRGVGGGDAGRWWAVMRVCDLGDLSHADGYHRTAGHLGPVRLQLADAVRVLRAAGYGSPLEKAVA